MVNLSTTWDKTQCPFCSMKTEEGMIRTGYSTKLWWLPKGMLFSFLTSFSSYVVKKGGVVFYYDPIFVIRVKARYCKSCNQMLIDGNENETKYASNVELTNKPTNVSNSHRIECPYCNKTLEDGSIRVAKSAKLWWLPNGIDLPVVAMTNQMIKKGAVLFKEEVGVIDLRARYCRDCHFIFLDGKENNAEYLVANEV